MQRFPAWFDAANAYFLASNGMVHKNDGLKKFDKATNFEMASTFW